MRQIEASVVGGQGNGPALAITWNDKKKKTRLLAAATATLVTLGVASTPAFRDLPAAAGRMVSVIVRELPGSGDAPERMVEIVGGSVGRHIGIIDGFVAQVPEKRVDGLRRTPWVHSVTPNTPIRFLHDVNGFDADHDTGSMFSVAQEEIGAGEFWNDGYTGQGVDVALIDTGVVAVDGLTAPGKVVNGPDLSFESQVNDLRYLDTYGHGTHMAGIIAGRDDAVTDRVQKGNHDDFLGVAPGARIVNVKVANALGATDVSQVLAAIDWVVQHRQDDGMNIRVLNLSFGTDGTQDYTLDPLTYAAEVAWRKGIVVVVAGGNAGFGSKKLNNPAYDPYVIAAGAAAQDGKYGTQTDTVPDWSSRGDGVRNPDLVAPGKSVVSLRDPGSYVDENHPEGYVNERFFRGSGTSQSAAVISGAAALIIQQRPNITPDQVKALLRSTASNISGADPQAQGSGMLDLKRARDTRTPSLVKATQTWPPATGTGSLELARGSLHLADEDGTELTGEQNIFGDAWDGRSWSVLSFEGRSWSGGEWLGRSWSGDCWCADSWSGRSWSGRSWSGTSWSGRSWSSDNWTGRSWSGRSWSGRSWSGRSWSGRSWSNDVWSGRSWSSALWS